MINPTLDATLKLLQAERSAVTIYEKALARSSGYRAELLRGILANHEDSVSALEECVKDLGGDACITSALTLLPVPTKTLNHGETVGVAGYKALLAAESVHEGVKWLVLQRLLPMTEDNLDALSQIEGSSDRQMVA